MKIQCAFVVFLICFVDVGFSNLLLNTPGGAAEDSSGYLAANKGDTVTLTCIPPIMATGVSIYRLEYKVNYGVHILFPTARYSSVEMNNEYQATIHEVDSSHSSLYGCRYCYTEAIKCYRRDCIERFDCATATAYLTVVASGSSDSDTSCSIVDNTNGIYFVGDSILIRCLGIGDSVEISVVDGDNRYKFQEDESPECDDCSDFRLTIRQVYNNATIVCSDELDHGGPSGENKCRGLPNINVYENLSINLSSTNLRVSNRENASLFCGSNLNFLASFKLQIINNGVVFGNISMVPVDGGVIVDLIDIDFTNSTLRAFNVSCNVTVGTGNAVEFATVSEEVMKTPRKASSLVVAITIPTVVGAILVCVIVASLVWYCRPSSEGTETTTKMVDEKEAGIDTKSKPRNNYSSGNARLGYSSQDVKVVDNVAYVPYDGKNP